MKHLSKPCNTHEQSRGRGNGNSTNAWFEWKTATRLHCGCRWSKRSNRRRDKFAGFPKPPLEPLQRTSASSASYQFAHDAANGRCTDREGLLRISSYQPYDTPMSPISLGPSMTAIETHNAHSLAALAWDSAPRAFDPTYRSGAASRDVSNRLFAAAASFKSASKLSGGLPSSNIPLNVA